MGVGGLIMSICRILTTTALASLVTVLALADGPSAKKSAGELPELKQLPNPFAFLDGSPVRTKEDWVRRRGELKGLFEDYEYGHLPPKPEKMTVKRGDIQEDEAARIARQDLELTLEHAGKTLVLHVNLTLPLKPAGPVPVLVQGGFGRPGNAQAPGKPAPRPNRLNVFTDRGYAVAELNFQEAAIDNKDRGRTAGVYQLFGDKIDCGALMAWAWGISRVIDAIETESRIDARKIVVTGHSRYGKAALLAGAFDDRIALTVPSHSGCSGAAPYRFIYGKSEQLQNAVGYAPQWFRPDFNQFVGKVERLPVDQHLLRALVAPRALLATEGTQDSWTNPEGSQLTHLAARKVYEFLGAPDRISIKFRPVGHVPSNDDLLDFADHVFFGKPLSDGFGKLAYPEEKNGFDWDVPR
jgi:(4-O-methyl)-D-glucuronate---lignin esterase